MNYGDFPSTDISSGFSFSKTASSLSLDLLRPLPISASPPPANNSLRVFASPRLLCNPHFRYPVSRIPLRRVSYTMKTYKVRMLAVAVVCAVVVSFLPGAVNAQKKSKAAATEAASADPVIPSAQKAEDPDLEFINRLREEEFRHGQVMDIMSNLVDNIGPRLTGSPNMKKANEWTRDQLKEWGLVNANV